MKPRSRHVRVAPGKRMIAVSDVHGSLPYLRGLLEKLRFGENDALFIVGDLVEKGKYSLETLRYVIDLSKTREVHLISGNCDWWYPILHDERLIRSAPWYINNKPYNLARQMCAEIGYPVTEDIDPADMRDALERAFPVECAALRDMPEIIETPECTFVHGGLPDGPPDTWDAWRVMKLDHYLTVAKPQEKWVVCGHWPVMLYHDSIVDANPIVDRRLRIASIDGGCVLKDDGQLNALIIPRSGEDFSFVSYDLFPAVTALDFQAPSERSWYIRWGDAEVEILRRGEEFCRCRHKRTGYVMDILTKYIYESPSGVTVNDCTDYELPVFPGDTLSLVEETSRGIFAKKNGVSGWYRGRIKPQNA